MSIKPSRIVPDGVWGEKTMAAIGIGTGDLNITGTIDYPKAEIKPFKCPCCGGNSYKIMNGKTVCEYCDTEFMR